MITNHSHAPKVSLRHISGTTMTIQGLAPSLISIINSSRAGEPIRMASEPVYDEDLAHGIARTSKFNTMDQIFENENLADDSFEPKPNEVRNDEPAKKSETSDDSVQTE